MTWKQPIKPTRPAAGKVQIGRAPIGFEQIRRSADLRGWYFGYLIARNQPSVLNGPMISQQALFVFAVDAYRQRPDTYLAEAILDVFLPVSVANLRMPNLLGLSMPAIIELDKLRGELQALLYKKNTDAPAFIYPPKPPIRQGRILFRANVFDHYQKQALPEASAAVQEFNQIVWPIIDRKTSGFSYEKTKLVSRMNFTVESNLGEMGWGTVQKLKAAGFNIVALLGQEGATAPFLH